VFAIFAALAEFERELISERSNASTSIAGYRIVAPMRKKAQDFAAPTAGQRSSRSSLHPLSDGSAAAF